MRGRHPERDARGADLALGAHEPLRHRRLGDQEGAGDLVGASGPPRVRSVSATCASTASAGWQQVNRSSSRSSGIVVVIHLHLDGLRDLQEPGLLGERAIAPIRSIARLRAVVTSHARGLPGVPSRGQRSAAIANASCAASSARSKSPRKPIRAARTRPHSSRKTRSRIAITPRAGRTSIAPPSRARGDPRRELDRGVEVVGLEEQIAAEDSLISTKGPSVVSVLPSCTRTVVAVSGRSSPHPGVTPGGLVDGLVVRGDRPLLVLGQRGPPPAMRVSARRLDGSTACTSSLPPLVESCNARETNGETGNGHLLDPAGWMSAWQDGAMRRLLFSARRSSSWTSSSTTAITPLLPTYVDDLGLSEARPACSRPPTPPARSSPHCRRVHRRRLGPRRTLLAGLLPARCGQPRLRLRGTTSCCSTWRASRKGRRGALAWAGALTWLIGRQRRVSRRGAVIGDVLGVAVAGALLGPAVGAAAEAIGTKPVSRRSWSWPSRWRRRAADSGSGAWRSGRLRETAATLQPRPVLRATLVRGRSVGVFGVIAVLVPLRINEPGRRGRGRRGRVHGRGGVRGRAVARRVGRALGSGRQAASLRDRAW